MAYRGRYGADSGGGYNNCGAVDPLIAGHYIAGGDVWGLRFTLNGGNSWQGANWGFSGSFQNCRACFVSKRSTTAGMALYGTGTYNNKGSDENGWFVATDFSNPYKIVVVDSVHGFGQKGYGSGAGATPAGDARRPVGDMIDSIVVSGTEYIFTVTAGGVFRYTNAGANAAAISGPTQLATPTDLPASNFFTTLRVLDQDTIIVVAYDRNGGGQTSQPAQQNSVLYLLKPTTGNHLTTATGTSQVTVSTLSHPMPQVYDLKKGKDGNYYAACGTDGYYSFSLSGTTPTWTALYDPDNFATSVDCASTGVMWGGQAGGDATNNNQTNMTRGHGAVKSNTAQTSFSYPASVSGAIHKTEFQVGDTTAGTGRTWWLGGDPRALDGNAYDCQMIRVDPFDDNKVIMFGRAGAWMTRDSGTTFYPAMNGMNGVETSHIKTTGATSLSADGVDAPHESHTNDLYKTAVAGSTYSGGGHSVSGVTTITGDDGKSYTFTPASGSVPATPAKLTRGDVGDITTNEFRGAIAHPTSIAVSQNSTVFIGQFGGGVYVMEPISGGGGGTTAPVITSFTPTTQSVGGTITVSGSGFTGTTSAKVNTTSVVTFSIVDDATLTLTVPVGATTGPISVTSNGLTGTSTTALNVTGAPPAAPTITSITPTSGSPGTTITIAGTNLGSATAVKIGGSAGLAVTPVTNTSTQITFKIPVGASSGAIFVQTAGGSVTSTQTLTVLAAPPPTGATISNLPQGALSRTATMQVRDMWTTDAQAIQVAQECVFISGPITMPRLATVMNTNPTIIIAPYLKSIQNPNAATDYDSSGTKYPAKWYVHMKDGTKAKQTGQFLNWLMESGYWTETRVSATQVGPLSGQSITATSWAEHHVKDAVAAVNQANAKAAQSGTNPFRSLWFDSNDTFSADATTGFWGTTNPGLNPHTNAAYTKPDFVSMAHYIGDMAENKVVANANPNNLWTVANGLRSVSIADHYDMAMAEGWMVAGGLGGPLVKTQTKYEANMQLVLDCQAKGCVAELLEWAVATDTAVTATTKRRYSAASYIIAHRGLATFEFSQPKGAAPWLETAKDPNLYAVNLGLPLNGQSPTTASGHRVAVGASNGQASATGLYARLFDGGIAIVNITNAAINYKADRTYSLVTSVEAPTPQSYSTGTNISVPSGSGMILTSTASGSAPANTQAPYILNSPVEGQTLRRDEGVWTGNPTPTFTDQWQVSPDGSTGWTDIAGATSPTFAIPFGTSGTSATTIAADAYSRTVASGWGTADTGGSYTVQQGSAADFAVSSTGTGSSGGFVQLLDAQSPTGTATTLTLTIPTGGVPTGHTVIIAAGSNNKAVTSITDSRSNTYQNDGAGLPASLVALNVYSAKVTTALLAGDTITVTYSASVGGRSAVATEYQGFLTASWNDSATTHVTSIATTTATTDTNTMSAATAQANEIIVSAICIGPGPIGAPGTDAAYTLRGSTEQASGTQRRVAIQSKKDSAIETAAATWTWGNPSAYVHVITGYKLVTSTASVGTVSHGTANTGKMITLPVSRADVDIYWDSNFPTSATGGNLQSSPMIRFQDTNNFLDLNAVFFASNGTLSVAPRKVIAGTATNLGTAKSFGTYSTSDYIHYRLKAVGSHIQAKAWVGSASEPVAWDWDFSDSSLTTAGLIGVRSFKGSANTTPNPITVWDNLTASSVTGTVTGYVTDYLRDNVTGKNANGTTTVTSTNAGPVTSGATGEPQWTTLPSITGSPAELQTLTANPGAITGSPSPTVSYQWQTSSDGAATTWVDVAGATSQTWGIPSGSANLYARVKVTATNAVKTVIAYAPKQGPIVGSDVAPQFTSQPFIVGTAIAGQVLTANPGTVTGSPTPTITQVWQSSPDAGATWNTTSDTDSSYLLDGGDVGALIRVAVTATNRVDQTEAFSDPVGPVQPPVSAGGLTIGVSVE